MRLCQRIFSHIDARSDSIESAGNAVAIRGRDREEISMPVEARDRRPKQHRLRFVRSKVAEVTLISTRGILLGLCAILPRESTRSLEKRQHVDQFKAPADIRRAARPAELIALRALARRGVSELAPVPGLI